MTDVEAMYHQVQVPEDQQSFLKFLCWENHDIDTEPHDYVMCAHVFWCNIVSQLFKNALRRRAVQNEVVFGEAGSNALYHKFYSDDFLSV